MTHYKSMILSIITYSSWCFYPSIKNTRLLESLQKKIVIGSLVIKNYKDALIKLKNLPVPNYLQMLDPFYLSKLMNGSYDFSFAAKAVGYSPMENLFNTRSAASSLFQVQRPNLKLCEQNFWFHSTRLANFASSFIEIRDFDFFKKGLLGLFRNYFTSYFDEDVTCTWKMHCDCVECNCKKLIGKLPT